MALFYWGTGVFAAIFALHIAYRYITSHVPYPLFFTGIAFVFWAFFAASRVL